MVTGPNGVSSVNNAQRVDTVPQRNSKTININIGEPTEAANATKKKIETAAYKIEELMCERDNPSTSKERKAEIQKEIDELKNVYKNTTINIRPDGSVEFKFKNAVNVEAFKKAYNIKDEALREHLKKQHENFIGDEDEYLSSGTEETDGENIVHYREDGSFLYTKDSDYDNQKLNSSKTYADGYRLTWKESGLLKRKFPQIDYSNMCLDNADVVTLAGDKFK